MLHSHYCVTSIRTFQIIIFVIVNFILFDTKIIPKVNYCINITKSKNISIQNKLIDSPNQNYDIPETTCIFINTNILVHMCICTHFTTSHYVYNYVLMDIHKYITIHTFLFIQILMSVMMEHMIAPKHVQTLLEALFVDVIVVIYWMLMELLVMVCINFQFCFGSTILKLNL